MTTRTRSGTWRALLVACLAALAVLLPAGAASAHASLLSTDPPDGTVVPVSPRLVTFTFDEAVSLPPDAVQIFDAAGDPVPTDVVGRGAVLSASVPDDLADGTYVVAWRVISADSHPVAGSLTFSVGAPSLTVAPPKIATPGSDGSVRTALGMVGALDYTGLLLAGGLLGFGLWTARGLRLTPAVRRRVARVTVLAAAVAGLAAVALVPLNGADDLGLGLGHALTGRALDWSLVADEVVVAALQVGGLGAAGLLARRRSRPTRLLATAAAAVAVVSPAWVGHSRATDPVWAVMATDVTHLLAGAVWFGGLVGLALVLGALAGRPRAAATALSRFSAQAAVSLALLTVTGSFAAWRIVGSWSALVDTGYGRVLLVKVGVVALVALVAGLNRWRLLPRVTADAGHTVDAAAVRRVRTAVRCEAGLLVVVLGLTGFLVDLSPNLTPATRPDAPSKVAAALVGDDRVLATLTPGSIGPNTLTVQVQDQAGEPIEGYAAPTVSISTPGVDLGQVAVHPIAQGTYAGRVVLPRAGTWAVSVSLRTGRFDNPVTEVDVQVR